MTATGVLGNREPVVDSPDAAAKERSRRRRETGWRLRHMNSWLFAGERIGKCGEPLGKTVAVKHLEVNGGTAQPANIATCGSVWGCTACAGKIRSARAAEIEHLVRSHLAAGRHATMLTFTLPHTATDALSVLLAAVMAAWAKMVSGSVYSKTIRDQYGIIGFIRALEVTYGRNGWHPHLHVLVFHTKQLWHDDGTLDDFRWTFAQRWARFISQTLGREIHHNYGVDATPVRDHPGIGAYVSKIHFELARSDLKTNKNNPGRTSRTPWQVAIDGDETGDAQDIARWKEFVRATKGRRMLGISPELRRQYGHHDTADKTDTELAAETQDGDIVATIDRRVWLAARRHRARALIAAALLAYETNGLAGMTQELATVGAVTIDDHDHIPHIRFTRNKETPRWRTENWSARGSGVT